MRYKETCSCGSVLEIEGIVKRIPREWLARISGWRKAHLGCRKKVADVSVPILHTGPYVPHWMYTQTGDMPDTIPCTPDTGTPPIQFPQINCEIKDKG